MQPFLIDESEVPVEQGAAEDGAGLSWRTLISADRTPTRDLSSGVCEILPGGALVLHRHPTMELYYFLEGEGVVRLNDREHAVQPGTTVSIPANVPHGIRNTGASTLKLFYVFLVDSYGEVQYTMLESAAVGVSK